ncbi:MAG: hypothetical protein BVN35_08080 [Proteobacteria bacterium ST_bin11]|nr:MAG: hypothetical protein BVN35_08080 [Proteobacteria bacterium ST_bin11]
MSAKVSTESQPKEETSLIPPVQSSAAKENRQMRTAIPYAYYARLEFEAARRGMSGYALAALLLKKSIDENFPLKPVES